MNTLIKIVWSGYALELAYLLLELKYIIAE